MKKLIVSMFLVAFSVTVMATKITDVRITLSGSNPTYSLSTVRLIADDARTAEAEGGYDAPCMMSLSNDNSTLIYGMIGSSEYSTVATNDLTGQYVGFTTNNVDDDYSLTFSDFSGDAFYLYDLVAGEKITVNGSTPVYNFSATSGRVAVTDRFIINLDVDEGNLETCFTGTELNITNNPYWNSTIVVKDGGGTTKGTYDYGTSTIDFNEKDGSGNNIYANNTEYTVYFDKGNRAFIVKVKR